MTPPSPDLVWRRAGPQDAEALRDLERRANLAGLGHVFGDRSFPDVETLERWRRTLAEPGVVVEVVEAADGLTAYLARDRELLRHLAVDPAVWGRGVGRDAVRRAQDAGATRLWVLELNTRARRLYESLGWLPNGVTQACPWEPHPLELQYVAPEQRGG
ncbi:MAG: GNAT family N-acetyltransferase [Nocardioides sp.]|nr:GNAT family N-acetyltransferase [Nocardioides sp.]